MPVRPIIEVDVDTSKFDAFKAKYDKFNVALNKMPDAWAAAGENQEAQAKGFTAMAAAMLAYLEMLRQKDKAEKESRRNLAEQSSLWDNMSRSTKSVAANIAGATSQLLKWTALTSVFSGLLGAGGLFGIERLASGVASGRRSSQGLGVSYGEQRSFETNFSRVVDPGSFLASVNEAQHDVTKRPALYGAGLRDSDINGRNAAQVGSQLLNQLKKIVDSTPEAQLAQTLQARRLDQFIGLQDAQRLRNMSPAELAQLQSSNRTDQGALGLNPANQKVWADFSTQMERAGGMIENTFVKGLTPLIPGLNSLSGSVTKAVEAFLSAPKLKEWITDLGTGLEKVATYVGTDEFQDKVQKFVKAFGEVADMVVKAAGWITNVKGAPAGFTGALASGGGSVDPSKSGFGWFPNVGSGDTKNMSPEFVERLTRLRNAMPRDLGGSSIASGYRSEEEQQRLREHNPSGYPVAQGTSGHTKGIAADLKASQAGMDWLHAHAAEYGLSFPVKNDPVHVTMAAPPAAPAQGVKITIYGAPGGNTIANAQQAATPGSP